MARVYILGEDNGGDGTRTCQCREKMGNLKCSCSQSKYFIRNAPKKWICDDCSGGTHNFYGLSE